MAEPAPSLLNAADYYYVCVCVRSSAETIWVSPENWRIEVLCTQKRTNYNEQICMSVQKTKIDYVTFCFL